MKMKMKSRVCMSILGLSVSSCFAKNILKESFHYEPEPEPFWVKKNKQMVLLRKNRAKL